jgi:hypothetical protein
VANLSAMEKTTDMGYSDRVALGDRAIAYF